MTPQSSSPQQVRISRANPDACSPKPDSDPFCTDDQTPLEGGDGGARLQGKQVPPPYPPRYPILFRSHLEALYHPVVVASAFSIPEGDPISFLQPVEAVEDEVASCARPS